MKKFQLSYWELLIFISFLSVSAAYIYKSCFSGSREPRYLFIWENGDLDIFCLDEKIGRTNNAFILKESFLKKIYVHYSPFCCLQDEEDMSYTIGVMTSLKTEPLLFKNPAGEPIEVRVMDERKTGENLSVFHMVECTDSRRKIASSRLRSKAQEPGFNRAKGLREKAKRAIRKGDFAAALQDLDASLSFDPTNKFTFWQRGQLKMRLENYPDAIADFKKAGELDPKDFRPRYEKARAQLASGDLNGALAEWAWLHQIEPTNHEYAFLLAISLFQNKDFSAAEKHFEKLTKNKSDCFEIRKPLIGLAMVRNAQGRFKEALELFDSALALNPQAPGVRLRKAIARAGLKDQTGACGELDAAMRINKNIFTQNQAQFSLDDKLEMNDFQGMIFQVDTAIDKAPDPSLLWSLKIFFQILSNDSEGAAWSHAKAQMGNGQLFDFHKYVQNW
jgi:tetratricopeptide (TPR) repeat protein